jgi:hypothetical protein
LPDRLHVDQERMRTAVRARDLERALRICKRIAATLRTRIDESRAPKAATDGRGNGKRAIDGDRVRHSQLAHRLGIDPRTLLRHIADQEFVEHPVPRVHLVHVSRFERWYAERGRKL